MAEIENGKIESTMLGIEDHEYTIRQSWYGRDQMATTMFGKQPIVMCHYALRVWDRSHYGSLHLYGHSHGTLPGDNQSLDVGVDCWDFTPVNIEQIRERMKTLPTHPKEF